jgi:hypothetical protein
MNLAGIPATAYGRQEQFEFLTLLDEYVIWGTPI